MVACRLTGSFAGIVAISVVFIFSAALHAQVGTASLKGVIADPSGAVIPDAQITLESTLLQFVRTAESDTAGNYVIYSIPPGEYELLVEVPGFAPEKRSNISLSSGQASTLNVTLRVAATTAEITVLEAPPLLQTSDATLGTAVESKQIRELPLLGRNYTSLMLVLPGSAPVPSPGWRRPIQFQRPGRE